MVLKDKILDCIVTIGKWVASNRLLLNPTKSEDMWCSKPRQVHFIDRSSFHLKDRTIKISSVIRNLGAFFDESVSISIVQHVSWLVRTYFYQFRQLKCIRNSLPLLVAIAILLIKSFVFSWVDYCNSILVVMPKFQLNHIQYILSVEARMILSRGHHDHVTPLLWDRLHWLWHCLFIYKVLNGLATDYLSRYCVNTWTNCSYCSLQSSTRNHLIILPHSQTVKCSERSFLLNVPNLWNKLSDNVKDASLVDILNKRLQTHRLDNHMIFNIILGQTSMYNALVFGTDRAYSAK